MKLISLLIAGLCITIMLQAQVSKTLSVTAGGLSASLTGVEKNTVTNLTLTGTIDARDFKTMRDDMPMLAMIDISGVEVVAYNGIEGTAETGNNIYPINTIPRYAFRNPITNSSKRSLTICTLPSSITTIGSFAFQSCCGLVSVNIPSSVTTIESLSFNACGNLGWINIPVSVTFVGDGAFSQSSCLLAVDDNNSKFSSEEGFLFDKAKTKLIHCPMYKTGSYSIPSTVTAVESDAFSSCIYLKSVTIPSSVASIEIGLFSGCISLESIFIPTSVTSIGQLAFMDCSSLLSVIIPSSVSQIGSGAFKNCRKINSITSKSSIPINLNSSPGVFENVDKTNCKLYVPSGSKSAYQSANQWQDFAVIEEMPEFNISANAIRIAAAGGEESVEVTTSEAWSANSNQAWLTINPTSGLGNKTIILSAEENPSSLKRTALVTLTNNSNFSQSIEITQPGSPRKVNVTAGGLATALTSSELSTISNLSITGTIDARDFKTMRDNMPLLADLDLSGVSIAAYTGTQGTYNANTTTYPANSTPQWAFSGKKSLISVILPNSITAIAWNTFNGCSGLSNIDIPSSVKTIGQSAFSQCIGLTSIAVPWSVTSIGFMAFSSCTNLSSFIIPQSVTLIDAYAFVSCIGLTSINIPATVTNIQYEAFSGCGNVNVDGENPNYSSDNGILFNKMKTTLIHFPFSKTGNYFIPISVSSIAQGAFRNCENLISVHIPSSVTSIGSFAFFNCSGLQSIYTNGITPVNLSNSNRVFDYVDLTKCFLYVPYETASLYSVANKWQDFENIVEIGSSNTFNVTAGNLSTILTPEQLDTCIRIMLIGTIDARDFKTMRDKMPVLAEIDLSEVTIVEYNGTEGTSIEGNNNYPANSIPECAFLNENWNGKLSLKNVVFPNSLNTISRYSFTNCNGLTSISLPPLVTIIGNSAFATCNALSLVNIPISVTSIEEGAFRGCPGFIDVAPDNPNYSSIDGVLFNKTQTELIQFPTSNSGDYTIPSTVITIGSFSFFNSNFLTSITIPSSVTTIKNAAFYGCGGLIDVTIPLSVTSIERDAFLSCTGLINVDANNPNYSSIDGVLFNKTQTILIQSPTSNTGSFILPSSVVTIQQTAFSNCSKLTSLVIPPSVTSIGGTAFLGCSGLTSVTVGRLVPIDLSSYWGVFFGVNVTTCTLNVPYGSKTAYQSANQWQDFQNIIEMPGFSLSLTTANVEAEEGSTTTISISSDVTWTATSDQTWLTIDPVAGSGVEQTVTLTATEANTSALPRVATVTVSAEGVEPQTITVTQAGSNAAIEVTAGNLINLFSSEELATITKLTLTGTIDARDFKTMRDEMPLLAEIDLSGVTIVEYYGTEGTSIWGNNNYPANTIPEFAFMNSSWQGKTNLTSIILPTTMVSFGKFAFSYCSGLSVVSIPTSVTTIGEGTFNGCQGLTSISIPSSVTLIGYSAFSNCTAIPSISIPASVTTIQSGAFIYCTGLINVDEYNMNYSSIDGILFNKTQTTLIQCPISKTGSFVIPSSVVTIGQNAFYMSILTSVSIPSSVQQVEDYAFTNCSNFTTVTIPSSVTTIGNSAFQSCSGLTSFIIPSSVISIGNDAFNYCTSLTSIYSKTLMPVILSSTTEVFYQVNKTTCILYVPYGSKPAYQAANQWQDFQNIVEMPGFSLSLTTANVEAEEGSTTTVNISSDVTWTSTSDQSWLTVDPVTGSGVEQTVTLTAIEANTSATPRVATVTVSTDGVEPQTIKVTQAGSNAAIEVTAGNLINLFTTEQLATITKLTLTGTIDARDFKTMRDEMPLLAEIDLRETEIVAYIGTEGTSPYNNDYPANTIPYLAFISTITGGKASLKYIALPTSATVIGYGAFNECKNLTSVIIPHLISIIENDAFTGSSGDKIVDTANSNYSSKEGVLYNKEQTLLIHCPISKTGAFTIPSTVTSTGWNSFWDCKGITSVIIPSSVTTIDVQSFWGCSGLSSIEIPTSVNFIGGFTFTGCTGLSSFEFPSSVTSIGDYTFQNCSGLNTVIIPSSVTSIGNRAFTNCSALSSIYVYAVFPVDLSASTTVFNNVNKTTCTLYVPFGSQNAYQTANQWQDFQNIVEMTGINLSATSLKIDYPEGSSAWVNISSNVEWTATSDQSWLSINPENGINNGIITFTATENNNYTERTVIVTVSAAGEISKTISITQNANVSSCPQHFHTVWEGTSGTNHMNINVLEAKMDGIDLEPGDEIAVFDGDLCVGFGKVFKTIDQQNILNIIVSKNDGSGNGFTGGNEVIYKFWDCSSETEIIVNDVQCFNQLNPVTCLPFEALATTFVRLSAISDICQTLQLSAGWNMFSVPVTPKPADIVNVFQPCILNKSLVKIQDEGGKSVEDWGIYGGWQNYIGDISPTEGYKIKLSKNDILEVCGTPVKYPFPIPLKSGWNIIGFPHTIAVDGLSVLQQLMDSKTLVKVQDEGGKSIEDWGIFGGWTNGIGDFVPGEGYALKVNADETLWIYESYPKSSVILTEVIVTNHFKPAFEGNGLDHMNINMVGLPVNILRVGYELAVFDGKTCVGAISLTSRNINNQAISIAASARDNQGMPGFTEGNPITLKLWNSKQNTEYTLEPEIVKGSAVFAKHETTFASLEKYATTGLGEISEFDLTEINCYPNPFSDEVTVEIKLAKDSEVQVEVLNQLGQRVKILQTAKMLNSGVHRLTWNGRNAGNGEVASGIYHLKIQIDGAFIHRKIIYSN